MPLRFCCPVTDSDWRAGSRSCAADVRTLFEGVRPYRFVGTEAVVGLLKPLLEMLGDALDVPLPGTGFFVVTTTVRVRILGGLEEPNMMNECYAAACVLQWSCCISKECVEGACGVG
jgi:hypothetical protein